MLRRFAAGILCLAISGVVATHALASPQLDYMLECQGCHLSDGSGKPGAVPRLDDSVARFLAVAGGREYLVRVPGVAQSPLDDAALSAVLNWLVLKFGPREIAREAAPFTASEVAKLRREPLVEVDEMREALLREFSQQGLEK